MNRITNLFDPCDPDPLPLFAWLRHVAQKVARAVGPKPARKIPASCLRTLHRVREAVLRADHAGASEALAEIDLVWADAKRCPAYANLRGATHELRREWRLARRWYGKAIRADRTYLPAQQNMRRIYELLTFGRSKITFSLDVQPAAAEGSALR